MRKLLLSLTCLVLFVSNLCAQNYDVKKYIIHLDTINIETKTIYAHTNIIAELAANVQSLTFDLLQMTVDNVTVNGTQVTSFVSTNSTITVNTNLFTQGSNEIHIWYHGIPFAEDWGGVIFNGEYVYNLGVGISTIPHNLARAWFPCNDNFADKAIFEYYITVPENKIASCGGVLQNFVTNANNTKTYYYKSTKEIACYLASFAIGEYEIVEDTHQGLNGTIPITYVLRPSQVNAAQVMFQNIHEIMDIFEDKFGPYMFDRIGYTATSIGAMEHQNNISFPNSCITASLTYESLYAHELFHSWFGNLITCATAEDMWINEGWASFGEMYFEEELYDKSKYMANIRSAKNSVFNTAHKPNEDGGYFPLNQIPQTNTYGVSAYKRGAIVVHSLRNYLGDALFFSSVKQMLATHAYTAMSSEDLCQALSTASGVDLSGFFHNYVYQGGVSGYLVDSCVVAQNGNFWNTEIYIQQKIRNRQELSNGNRVEVTFMNRDLQTETLVVEFDGQHGHKSYTSSIQPEMIFVNYFDAIYDARFGGEMMVKTTGMKTIPGASFQINVDAISDSSFIYAAHYMIEPNDALKVDGQFRLSNNHFWKVDLINYGTADIKGIFNFSQSGNEADLLLQGATDTICLMYRPNYASKWQKLDVTIYGSSLTSGMLVYDNLISGEYAFAIPDTNIIVSINNYPKESGNILNVFPNPSNGIFNIHFNADAKNQSLIISDINGKKVKAFILDKDTSELQWSPKSDTKSQVYIFVLQRKDGKKYTQKAFLVK